MASSDIDEEQEERRLDELARKIREPNEKLLAEWMKEQKKRVLSNKLAAKADKLLIKDSIRERKNSQKINKPGGFTGRIAKRTGGAAVGMVSDLIGGIPIAGAIFKAIKAEASATLEARQEYKEELKAKRQEEISLLDELSDRRMASIREESQDIEDSRSEQEEHPVFERISEPVLKLTESIKVLSEVVEDLSEISRQEPKKSNKADSITIEKIRDPAAMDLLRGIDANTHENLEIADRHNEHTERMTEKEVKDIGNIKWHMARANGSVGRIETMMKIGGDRDNDIKDTLEDTNKLAGKSLEVQRDSRFTQILSLVTNLFNGGGLMKMLGSGFGALKNIAVPVLAVGAAWEIGQAIGKELHEWLSQYSGFSEFTDTIFRAVDHLLAFAGNADAKERLKVYEKEKTVGRAASLVQGAIGRGLTAQEEDHVRKTGTLPGMSVDDFNNKGSSIEEASWGYAPGWKMAKSDNDLMEMIRSNSAYGSSVEASSILEAEKEKADFDLKSKRATQTIDQSNINTTNNNSQVNIPMPLNADPVKELVRKNR